MSNSLTVTANIIDGGTIVGDVQEGFTIVTDVVESTTVEADVIAGGAGPQGPTGAQGEQGETGPQGEPGEGVPAGGTAAQVLAKASSTDYDTEWVEQTYVQAFTNSSTVNVEHNLGRKPAVTVTDSAGDEVEGHVTHLGVNEFIVTFSSSFTGTVLCN